MTNRHATDEEIRDRQAMRHLISKSEIKEPTFLHMFYFAVIVVCVFGLIGTILQTGLG